MGAKKYIPVVRYPGKLGEPHIRIKAASYFVSLLTGQTTKTDAERETEARDANLDALNQKLELLAEHYGAVIDTHLNWRKLAIELAFAHVPGFTTLEDEPRRRGRPGKSFFNFDLYAAVLDILDDGESSVANACRTLCKRPGAWKGAKPESVEARFHESKRRAATMDLRPHLGSPPPLSISGVSPSDAVTSSASAPPKPSAKYPPVPFRLGGLFGLGATALYDHEKSEQK